MVKAAKMDADVQYTTAITIRAKVEVATDKKEKAASTKTSTDLFADIEAIGRYVDAKNAVAAALYIKLDRLRIVATKLKVVEEAASLPTIPSKLVDTEDKVIAPTSAIKSTLNAKLRNPSAIIDDWSLTANNSIDGFMCGSKTHTDGQRRTCSINHSPSEGSMVTTSSGSIYFLGKQVVQLFSGSAIQVDQVLAHNQTLGNQILKI